ncbi:aminotransferase class I/II-fold pyridoxal phosphate-dependent enzyme [Saccharopolyspora shandongensis]|uniref:aminotransferase class I/II-fold pyridoxal phosphate-dependent enzyme n=1 Tax=Saccharopolyspora shandongensis TaxID=418495 RepID=UPI0033FD8024
MVLTAIDSWVVRMDRNECAALLPGVGDVLRADADGWHRYPDSSASVLTEMLAAHTRLHPDAMVVGAGSAELLARVLRVACAGGGEVVFADPSFEAYAMLARQAGAEPVAVPTTAEGVTDVEGMLAAVTPATRVMIVCNPHNPTGSVIRRPELEYLLAEVGSHVMVVLDEAYRELTFDPDVPDGIELARSRSGVVVTRTFSKVHGLAGLRVGYLAAPPPLAEVLRHAAVPYQISAPAQAAAMASLRQEAALAARCAWIAGERERMRAALREHGFQTPHSHGNFVWIPLRHTAEAFAQHCVARGFVIRSYPGAGVRVSLGTPAENTDFVQIAAQARRLTRPDRRVHQQDAKSA